MRDVLYDIIVAWVYTQCKGKKNYVIFFFLIQETCDTQTWGGGWEQK
jgi:hypothetical protein